MKSEEALLGMSALAHESRLTLFRLLVKRGPDGYTPTELAKRLDMPAPTLSFHLKELQRARLIGVTRKGRHLHYSPNFPQVEALVGFLTENCCSLGETEREPSSCQPVTRKKRA